MANSDNSFDTEIQPSTREFTGSPPQEEALPTHNLEFEALTKVQIEKFREEIEESKDRRRLRTNIFNDIKRKAGCSVIILFGLWIICTVAIIFYCAGGALEKLEKITHFYTTLTIALIGPATYILTSYIRNSRLLLQKENNDNNDSSTISTLVEIMKDRGAN